MNILASRSGLVRIVSVVALAALTAGCAKNGNIIDQITGKNDTILPGKRESALGGNSQVKVASEPVVIPTAKSNSSWAQPGGVPSNVLQNLSLGRKLRPAFSVDAGKGSTSAGRLTAIPIVVANKIFVMDSRSVVRAFSTNNGAQLWSVSLVPKGKSADGKFGGGLASNGTSIFAVTPFGEVIALSVGGGNVVWRKKVSGAVKTAPTVAGGRVYFVTTSNSVNALSASNGDLIWKSNGAARSASAISNTSPAVSSGVVIAPHTTGDIVALASGGGQKYWSENLASSRSGGSVANLNAITGRPVIAGGQVYAISSSGRMASIGLKSGVQTWSKDISGNQTPWVSGEYVFVISKKRRLVAISRRTGSVKWVSELSGGGRWTGPVMGGGRLLVASDKGVLASISPQTGQLMNKISAGNAFYIAPVIAGNTVYLLDDGANLIALR